MSENTVDKIDELKKNEGMDEDEYEGVKKVITKSSKFNVNLTFDMEDMKIFKPETKSIKNHLMKLVIKHLITEGLVQQNDFDNIERKLVAGLKNK